MSNELIVIEQANAVAVLSTDDGIKTLLDNVRANIDSMGGGSMKNKASRKKIRTNAFAATKAFKKINDETIEPLIADLTKKIQPQLNVINAVKANQSVLQAGLQQIRKDVNADVDKFEAELQRVEDEKAELARIASIDKDWDFAQMMMKEYFSLIKQGDFEVAHMKKLADEKVELERIAREKLIAEEAAAAATLAAEQKAMQEKINAMFIDAYQMNDAHNEKLAADKREAEAVTAKKEVEKREAKLKEERRVDYRKRMVQHIIDCGNGTIGGIPQSYGILFFELENKIVIDDSFEEFKDQALTAKNNAIQNLKSMQEKQAEASKAAEDEVKRKEQEAADAVEFEKKRSAEALKTHQATVKKNLETAAENARKAEQQKQIDAANKVIADRLDREAKDGHKSSVMRIAKEALMQHAVLTEDQAKATIKAIGKELIPAVTLNF